MKIDLSINEIELIEIALDNLRCDRDDGKQSWEDLYRLLDKFDNAKEQDEK